MSDPDREISYGLWATIAIVLFVVSGTIGWSQRTRSTMAPIPPPPVAQATKESEFGLGLLAIVFSSDGKVTLDGAVRTDRKKDRLLSQANVVWGSSNVIDQIRVDRTAPLLNWRGRTLDFFTRLKAAPGLTAVRMQPQGIILEGATSDLATGIGLTDGLRSFLVDNALITSALTVNPQISRVTYDANTLLNESVAFASGSAVIPDSAKVRLAQIANVLAEDNRKLLIVGHSDNQGDAAMNRKLSLARAASVVEFLISNGVAADNLAADGAGPDKPIADNQTAEGRQKNRRIEFKTAL